MEEEQRLELITRREAARRTGLGDRQIRQAVDRGEISLYRVGGWPRVDWADVSDWIERHRIAQAPPIQAGRNRKTWAQPLLAAGSALLELEQVLPTDAPTEWRRVLEAFAALERALTRSPESK